MKPIEVPNLTSDTITFDQPTKPTYTLAEFKPISYNIERVVVELSDDDLKFETYSKIAEEKITEVIESLNSLIEDIKKSIEEEDYWFTGFELERLTHIHEASSKVSKQSNLFGCMFWDIIPDKYITTLQEAFIDDKLHHMSISIKKRDEFRDLRINTAKKLLDAFDKFKSFYMDIDNKALDLESKLKTQLLEYETVKAREAMTWLDEAVLDFEHNYIDTDYNLADTDNKITKYKLDLDNYYGEYASKTDINKVFLDRKVAGAELNKTSAIVEGKIFDEYIKTKAKVSTQEQKIQLLDMKMQLFKRNFDRLENKLKNIERIVSFNRDIVNYTSMVTNINERIYQDIKNKLTDEIIGTDSKQQQRDVERAIAKLHAKLSGYLISYQLKLSRIYQNAIEAKNSMINRKVDIKTTSMALIRLRALADSAASVARSVISASEELTRLEVSYASEAINAYARGSGEFLRACAISSARITASFIRSYR